MRFSLFGSYKYSIYVCIYIYICICVCVCKYMCMCMYICPKSHPHPPKKTEKKKQSAGLWESLGSVSFACIGKKNFSPMLTGFPHEPSQARLMHRVSSVPLKKTEIPGLLDTDCRSHGKPYQPCKQLGKPSDWSDQRTQLGHSNGLGQLGKIEERSSWMLLPVRNMFYDNIMHIYMYSHTYIIYSSIYIPVD